MSPLSTDKETNTEEPLFGRPPGILLDEKQWLFLKKRYNMTPRELQVAILICRGFNNDEIAKALRVRHGTVKTHLRNIYRRIRVKSKILLLLRFVEDINRFYPPSESASPPVPISENRPTTPGQTTPKTPQKK